MKKLIFLLFVIVNFAALYLPSAAQVKSRIIFKDGRTTTGNIIESKSKDSIYLMLDDNFNVAYPKDEILEIKSLRSLFNFGAG